MGFKCLYYFTAIALQIKWTWTKRTVELFYFPASLKHFLTNFLERAALFVTNKWLIFQITDMKMIKYTIQMHSFIYVIELTPLFMKNQHLKHIHMRCMT